MINSANGISKHWKTWSKDENQDYNPEQLHRSGKLQVNFNKMTQNRSMLWARSSILLLQVVT